MREDGKERRPQGKRTRYTEAQIVDVLAQAAHEA
jgi:hypothetical protein